MCATDTRAAFTAVGIYCAVADGDIAAGAALCAADTRAAESAVGCDCAAGNGDIAAVTTIITIIFGAAANARGIRTAGGIHRAAADGNVAAIASCTAADARAAFAAFGFQTVGSFVIAGDGEIAAVALLHTGVVTTALDGVGSIQLDGHVTAASDFHSSLIGAAGVNVHTAQGDICCGARSSVDGDSVGGGATAGLGDNRSTVRNAFTASLRYGLPALVGIDGDIAILQIPGLRKSRQRHTGCQQQRHDVRTQSSHFHNGSPFLRRDMV